MQDTPDDLVYDRFLQAAFPDQPLGRPILGTAKTVKSFTPDAIRAYLARHYHAGNMVLAASGAVDHDELVALAETHLAALPASPAAVPARENGHYLGGEARIKGDEEQVHLVLGFPGLPFRTARIIRCRSSPRCSAAGCRRGCSRRCASSAASPMRSTPSTGRSPIAASSASAPAPRRRMSASWSRSRSPACARRQRMSPRSRWRAPGPR